MGSVREYRTWTPPELAALKKGVQKHGLGAWEAIRSDPALPELRDRSGVNCKDKWRNLVKFKHVSRAEANSLALRSYTQRGYRRARSVAPESSPEAVSAQAGSSQRHSARSLQLGGSVQHGGQSAWSLVTPPRRPCKSKTAVALQATSAARSEQVAKRISPRGADRERKRYAEVDSDLEVEEQSCRKRARALARESQRGPTCQAEACDSGSCGSGLAAGSAGEELPLDALLRLHQVQPDPRRQPSAHPLQQHKGARSARRRRQGLAWPCLLALLDSWHMPDSLPQQESSSPVQRKQRRPKQTARQGSAGPSLQDAANTNQGSSAAHPSPSSQELRPVAFSSLPRKQRSGRSRARPAGARGQQPPVRRAQQPCMWDSAQADSGSHQGAAAWMAAEAGQDGDTGSGLEAELADDLGSPTALELEASLVLHHFHLHQHDALHHPLPPPADGAQASDGEEDGGLARRVRLDYHIGGEPLNRSPTPETSGVVAEPDEYGGSSLLSSREDCARDLAGQAYARGHSPVGSPLDGMELHPLPLPPIQTCGPLAHPGELALPDCSHSSPTAQHLSPSRLQPDVLASDMALHVSEGYLAASPPRSLAGGSPPTWPSPPCAEPWSPSLSMPAGGLQDTAYCQQEAPGSQHGLRAALARRAPAPGRARLHLPLHLGAASPPTSPTRTPRSDPGSPLADERGLYGLGAPGELDPLAAVDAPQGGHRACAAASELLDNSHEHGHFFADMSDMVVHLLDGRLAEGPYAGPHPEEPPRAGELAPPGGLAMRRHGLPRSHSL